MRAWVLTVIVAAAPSLFLLTFFYLKDRYEREPLQHILMAFGLGPVRDDRRVRHRRHRRDLGAARRGC